MAVYRQDMLYKDYTNNPIPTIFFYAIVRVVLRDYWEDQSLKQNKKDVGMGLLV